MNNPEPPPFTLQRAVPVAGPGIKKTPAKKAEAKPPIRAAQEAASPPLPEQPARAEEPEERRHHRVDLDTVMSMLELVKMGEREALRDILHILKKLKPTQRLRVLSAVNRVFQ